jgi:hypothetical protein
MRLIDYNIKNNRFIRNWRGENWTRIPTKLIARDMEGVPETRVNEEMRKLAKYKIFIRRKFGNTYFYRFPNSPTGRGDNATFNYIENSNKVNKINRNIKQLQKIGNYSIPMGKIYSWENQYGAEFVWRWLNIIEYRLSKGKSKIRNIIVYVESILKQEHSVTEKTSVEIPKKEENVLKLVFTPPRCMLPKKKKPKKDNVKRSSKLIGEFLSEYKLE